MESLAVLSMRLPSLLRALCTPGGIQQHILQRPAGDHAGNAGTGGLRLGSDDGYLFANQKVGQTGFANIGTANDSHKTEEVS